MLFMPKGRYEVPVGVPSGKATRNLLIPLSSSLKRHLTRTSCIAGAHQAESSFGSRIASRETAPLSGAVQSMKMLVELGELYRPTRLTAQTLAFVIVPHGRARDSSSELVASDAIDRSRVTASPLSSVQLSSIRLSDSPLCEATALRDRQRCRASVWL